jgi:hypothetical protein
MLWTMEASIEASENKLSKAVLSRLHKQPKPQFVELNKPTIQTDSNRMGVDYCSNGVHCMDLRRSKF